MKFKFIGLGLVVASQLAMSSQVLAIKINNMTDSALTVFIFFHGGGLGKNTIAAGKMLDVNVDYNEGIRMLKIFKLSSSGVPISTKPFICDQVFGRVIDIVAKNGDTSTLECK